MCGIAGIVRQEGITERDQTAVRRMVAAMVHRGPDDEGFSFGSQAAIGMRRLAIIDVPGGHQPIANEDGSVSVVFNGEIYNHRQLRERLDATGRHRFKTSSDTEVLVHLYEDMGRDLLDLLEGMFAFCIVDTRNGTALLARDRFGEKPLFFSVNSQGFAFSSELPALLEAPWVSRRANLDSLRHYLASGFVRGPATAFQDIRELEPGSWMEIGRGRLSSGTFGATPAPRGTTFADEIEAAEALQGTILQAIRRQMAADVPVGAFLSGGIDSSTVVAAMQRVHSQPVRTFTARFEHTLYDESPVAREVARHLGTEHHEIVITNGGFEEEDLRRVVRHVGQPFSDSSAIPTYHVCRQIRENVKVCLSGDGGDEMFAGYPLFQWLLRVDDIAARLPAGLARECARFLRQLASLPGADRWRPLRRLWRGLEVAALPARARLSHASRLFQDDELDAVCRPELAKRVTASSPAAAPHAYETGASRLRELMQERIEGSLRDDMLVKVDRMSMAASLEVRAPMLDAGMVDFASRLPDHWLIRGGVGKHILREAVRGWLPDIVFSHPKSGFSIPLHMFQNAAYEAACRDLLLSDRVPIVRDLLDSDATRTIVARGLAQKHDTAERTVYRSSHQLWSLLNLAAWADEFKVVAA
jgi:asparagine synthase (glutamine-hydrolysing)